MRLARRRFVELGQMVLIATALTQPVAAQSAAAQPAASLRIDGAVGTPQRHTAATLRERFKDRVTRVTLTTHGRDEVFEAAPR